MNYLGVIQRCIKSHLTLLPLSVCVTASNAFVFFIFYFYCILSLYMYIVICQLSACTFDTCYITITVCRSCYMTRFTGSTYHSRSTSSCVQLFIGASSARHHHIWLTFASQYPTLPAGSTYDLPTATNYMYSVVVARCSAIGPSLLPALRPGTHFQTTFETWHCHHILSE